VARRPTRPRCHAAIEEVRTLTGIKGRPRQTTGYHRCERVTASGSDFCTQHAAIQQREEHARRDERTLVWWHEVGEQWRRKTFSELPGGRWGPEVSRGR